MTWELLPVSPRLSPRKDPETPKVTQHIAMAQPNGFSSTPLTRLCARRLHTIATTPIPRHLSNKVTLAITDYLGAVASGLQAPWSPSVIAYAKARRGNPEAHAWGINADITAEVAAFVNATLGHSAIRDDMHVKANSHIGTITISAAMALAQRDGWTGEQLIRGVIGAYEMAALLGTAVQTSREFNRHLRPSGILGAFGSAAAAVAATNADEETAVNALGFAANMGSGTNQWAWSGGLEIYVEMGTAAMNGIVAFGLAKAGLKCSVDVLEGKAGVLAANGAGAEGEASMRKWLASTEIGKGIVDMTFKPGAGCNFAQTPVAVALKVAKEHNPIGIEKVVMKTTTTAKNYPGCDNAGPFDAVTQTKMSIQYGIAMVLTHQAMSEELFTRFDDRDINDLVLKCTIQPDAKYDKMFLESRQPASIEITLSDGKQIVEELADVPWLDENAVTARFLEGMQPLMSKGRSQEVLDVLHSLEKVKDCAAMFKLLKV